MYLEEDAIMLHPSTQELEKIYWKNTRQPRSGRKSMDLATGGWGQIAASGVGNLSGRDRQSAPSARVAMQLPWSTRSPTGGKLPSALWPHRELHSRQLVPSHPGFANPATGTRC